MHQNKTTQWLNSLQKKPLTFLKKILPVCLFFFLLSLSFVLIWIHSFRVGWNHSSCLCKCCRMYPFVYFMHGGQGFCGGGFHFFKIVKLFCVACIAQPICEIWFCLCNCEFSQWRLVELISPCTGWEKISACVECDNDELVDYINLWEWISSWLGHHVLFYLVLFVSLFIYIYIYIWGWFWVDLVFQEKIPPALPYARVALATFERLFGPKHSASIHIAILMHKVPSPFNF